MQPLTKDAARALRPGTHVYLEETGMLVTERITVTGADANMLYYGDGRGELWNQYNQAVIGWRLWEQEPTKQDREAEWEVWWRDD